MGRNSEGKKARRRARQARRRNLAVGDPTPEAADIAMAADVAVSALECPAGWLDDDRWGCARCGMVTTVTWDDEIGDVGLPGLATVFDDGVEVLICDDCIEAQRGALTAALSQERAGG